MKVERDDRSRPAGQGPETPRRSLLKAMGAVLAGAGAMLPPAIAGAATLIDPLRRRERDATSIRVASLSAIPQGAPPRRVTVSSDRVDGWTQYESTPVGAVYLRWEGDRVQALNVVCPHAGCSATWRRPERISRARATGAGSRSTERVKKVLRRAAWTNWRRR